jgi:xanthine dehydrogenase YagS FAD-binding subunit
MRPFDYARPARLDEAVALLSQSNGDNVRPLAGGTDLLTLMKADLAAPARLIDVKRLPELTSTIEENDEGIVLGALTTLAEIETNPIVRARIPALAEAAGLAATPQLRQMATIGGNLLQRPRCWYFRSPHVDCWLKGGPDCPARDGQNQLHALFGAGPCVAAHPSDPAAALLALDAEALVRGATGERTLPLAEFFALPTDERRTENVLRDDELIVSLRVPIPPPGARSTYLKAMDRKVWAFALVGVAAAVRLEGGAIADARIVLSGVAPIPWRAETAERVLIGAVAGPDRLARAAEAALAEAKPLAHNGYKTPLARALIRRALTTLTTG